MHQIINELIVLVYYLLFDHFRRRKTEVQSDLKCQRIINLNNNYKQIFGYLCALKSVKQLLGVANFISIYFTHTRPKRSNCGFWVGVHVRPVKKLQITFQTKHIAKKSQIFFFVSDIWSVISYDWTVWKTLWSHGAPLMISCTRISDQS